MRTTIAVLAVATSMAVAAPAAYSNHVEPNLGIDVTSVDAATRTVEGVQHCTTPDRAGRHERFTVTPDIEFGQFRPGMRTGIAVGPDNVILSTGEMPCRPLGRPAGGPGPGDDGPFGPPAPEGDDDAAGGPPSFRRGFLNRVWKFEVQVDDAGSGQLRATIEKVLNLPKKFRSDTDDLLDEDAIVLIGRNVRVYRDGKRVSRDELEDAESARVHGKLLPPSKWEEDEDDQPVATIRAKKIHLP